ncbi:LysE family transporter [Campylobacter upsaliensis]|uniref:LysE family transporter n=1 Tax=Campylobacter upsaliensis TaxID=28080 RepID=UPI002B387119|nr:LysE family transporter [Campylobacter upsaliensis]MEB2817127.1 LysE family transporter [Campylobacter upsaliensis]
MFKSLLDGILLGIGVAVPFGPVNLLTLSYALVSFRSAFFVGFGALMGDVFYLTLLNFGLLHFLNQTFFLKILAIFGFCFFTYIAFLTFRKKPENLEIQKSKIDKSYAKSFLKGLLLNLLNPYVIGFWLSFASLSASNQYPIALTLGLVSFIFIWILALPFFVGKFSHLFKAKVIYYINVFSALIIEYFALNLLYKTFWG